MTQHTPAHARIRRPCAVTCAPPGALPWPRAVSQFGDYPCDAVQQLPHTRQVRLQVRNLLGRPVWPWGVSWRKTARQARAVVHTRHAPYECGIVCEDAALHLRVSRLPQLRQLGSQSPDALTTKEESGGASAGRRAGSHTSGSTVAGRAFSVREFRCSSSKSSKLNLGLAYTASRGSRALPLATKGGGLAGGAMAVRSRPLCELRPACVTQQARATCGGRRRELCDDVAVPL